MSSLRQETLIYGLVGFTGGEEAAREYHDGLKDDCDDEGTFHLVSSHGQRNGYVYDPSLTRDDAERQCRQRPPSLTTDVVNLGVPSSRFFRVLPPAESSEDDGEFNVLLLVGGRVDCFIATGRRPRDPRFERGYFVDGAVAWGHTQTGEPFPYFSGKKPQRFWGDDRHLHVQRCASGALYLRRVMKNRAGEATHLRATVVTIEARWHDKDPERDDLLVFETATFHQDAPACSGRYYDPVPALFGERFQGPLERALALYSEHCRTPGTFSRPRALRAA